MAISIYEDLLINISSFQCKTDKLHVATAQWAQNRPALQSDNVFVQGVSFGGNAAARLFLVKSELDLAGVIYTCGIK